MVDAAHYRLAAGVQIVRREQSVLLVAHGGSASVRVSAGATALLPLLADGCSGAELERLLRARHPQASGVDAKLQTFLEPLARLGLLTVGEAAPAARRRRASLPLLRPDPLAQRLARQALRVPRRLRQGALLVLGMLAVAGVVQLALAGRLLHAPAMVDEFSLAGVLAFALLVVPLHEAAHALACRMAGAPVGAAGIVLHGYLVPGPYVETSSAYLVSGRWARFCIPAAGPLVNLLCAGAAAWTALLLGTGDAALQHAAVYVAMLCLMWVYFDTNPLGPSDGSHMLEAVLDDELARRNAFGFRTLRPEERRAARRYRIAACLHMACGSGLLYVWLERA